MGKIIIWNTHYISPHIRKENNWTFGQIFGIPNSRLIWLKMPHRICNNIDGTPIKNYCKLYYTLDVSKYFEKYHVKQQILFCL